MESRLQAAVGAQANSTTWKCSMQRYRRKFRRPKTGTPNLGTSKRGSKF